MVNMRESVQNELAALYAANPVQWRISDSLVPYEEAQKHMDNLAAAIAKGEAPETVWLLEHPPLYTAGTSADEADLVSPDRFPVYKTGRGGQYTYHGPGQRVAYVMLNLAKRRQDIRLFITGLEAWIIRTLEAYNIRGERREDRVGVWVKRPERSATSEDKIAAIGIRLRRWVTFHGISINIDPDLDHFSGIVPCGISEHGVTSFHDLGQLLDMPDVDVTLRAVFEEIFGPTELVE